MCMRLRMMDSFASLNGPDSLSLQEMLDLDIKSEKDLDALFRDTNVDFQELPAINLDEDSLGAPGENNVWRTSSSDDDNWLIGSDINLGITADFSSDENRMVSPYSVMPVTLIHVPYDKSVRKAEANFKPITVRTSHGYRTITPESVGVFQESIKGDATDEEIKVDDSIDEVPEFQAHVPRSVVKNNNQAARSRVKVPELAVKTASSTPKRSISVKSTSSKRRLHDFTASDNDLSLTMSAYPKPAYSYSCLIAMALKNSPGGSLPVSEIYNFMCEHFPYFKTAPNGWKNSVRHNLSLNKCFEKIEKPVTNGSQRKGCLWAMNPTKINKMDEEVQKWSKKDKTAIRKSMICPDTLDALERGQLSACTIPNTSEAESDEETWDRRGPRIVRHIGEEEDNDDDEEDEEGEEEGEEEEEEEDDDDDDEEDEDEEEEIDPKAWIDGISQSKALSGEDYDSDISLTDFDLDAETLYASSQATPNKVNVRVKVATSPNGTFQPLLSGAYTVNSQGPTDTSPKRLKTLNGGTITGNYVYRPFGTSNLRRKSPMRQSLLSSLEADD